MASDQATSPVTSGLSLLIPAARSAASPELVQRQAKKYGADVSGFIRDGSFVWHDFTSFLAAYDAASSLFRDEEDGEISYNFTMAILDIDLEEAG